MATAETTVREPMLQELFLLGSDSGLIVPSGSINLVYNIAGSSGGPWLPARERWAEHTVFEILYISTDTNDNSLVEVLFDYEFKPWLIIYEELLLHIWLSA